MQGLETAYVALYNKMLTLNGVDPDFPVDVKQVLIPLTSTPSIPFFGIGMHQEKRPESPEKNWIHPLGSRADVQVELLFQLPTDGTPMTQYLIQKAQVVKNGVRELTTANCAPDGTLKCQVTECTFAYELADPPTWGGFLITVLFAEYLFLDTDG